MFSIRAWVAAVGAFVAMAVVAGPALAAPGDLDTSFGSSGVVANGFGASSPSSTIASDVVAGSDGRLYVAGTAEDSSGDTELFVARYTAQGALDPSFGSGGVTVEQFGHAVSPQAPFTGNSILTRLALAPDGRIVVATSTTYVQSVNTFTEVAVARFTSAGQLDPSFGSGGVVLEQLSTFSTPDSQAVGVAVQPDGNVVLTGYEADHATGDDVFFAQRLLGTDGSPDPSFGTGGLFEQQLGAGSSPTSEGTDVLVQPDGKLLFSAEATDASGNDEFAATRLTSGGAIDPSFGVAEVQASPNTTTPGSEALRVRTQSNGDVVLEGVANDNNGQQEFALARFTPTGTLDTSFGSSGVFLRQLSVPGSASLALGLAVQGNDRLVVVGAYNPGPSSSAVANALLRLTPNGTLDPSFGSSGIVEQNLGRGSAPVSLAAGATITPDGQLVEAGGLSGTTSGEVDGYLARVQLDAPPSVSFSFAPAAPRAGQTVTFTSSASDDTSVASIAWDLGSGSFTATGPTASKAFSSPGTYTVRVKATDDDGLSTISSQQVTVGNAPQFLLHKVKPTHTGVSFKLTCDDNVTCNGAAQLSTLEKLVGGKVVAVTAKAKKKRLVVGKSRFSLVAGQTKTFTVHLNSKGKRLLAHFKKLPVTLKISLLNTTPHKVISKKVTIKAKSKHKHHTVRIASASAPAGAGGSGLLSLPLGQLLELP